jgi:hypothetical protein
MVLPFIIGTMSTATTILAIIAIVAATSLIPIHQVSATTPNPGTMHANANINPNAVQHVCANPHAAFRSNINCGP